MATKNKRSKLDVEISRVQKNTRNKIYRFRAKGVSDEEIAEIDPRRSTKGMTTKEKRAYLRTLQAFNGRETGYTAGVDNNGVAGLIKTSTLREYQKAERAANQYKRKLARAATRRYGSLPVVLRGNDMSMEDYAKDHAKGYINEDLAYERGYLKPVKRQGGFSSEAQALRAIEAQRNAVKKAEQVDKNLLSYKNAIVNKMMEENAPVEVVTRVRNLTLNQLQYLYYNTDFSADVQVFHYRSYYYEQGHTKPGQNVYTRSYESMVSAMDTAQRVVKSTPFRPLVRK